MAAPANNPFGAAPPQAFNNNPFGAPVSAFGAPAQNPFGAPASKPNPFGTPVANPFGAAPTNNPFGSRPSSAGNPFGAPSGNTSLLGTPSGSPAPSRGPSPSVAHNPFGKPPTQPQPNNPFGAPQAVATSGRSPSPFGSRAPPTGPSKPSGVSAPADPNAMSRRNKFAGGKPTPPTGPASTGGFGGRGGHNQGPQRSTPFAGTKPFAKQPNGQVPTTTKPQPGARNKQPERQTRFQPTPGAQGKRKATTGGPSERTKQLSTFAFNYANKLSDHLKKENITPPQWPAEPGNPDKRAAIESLKDAYKKYRARVYATLRKADLIDDPEKRRKLEDALPFKGICEDMCPEFEQCYRIAEYDVKTEEKETRPDGLAMWPDVTRMVKKFGRSAAGQDAPLPMDVRSVDALRRTTDYLFNDLLQSESNLPSMHNFLWDRTRAVRKDFTFHSQKSAEEMKDMVYCFETITRFHATALHLLSRKGFANEDFDQKQEIEQLGRTILSLIEAYDVCRDKQVHCENEPEFRAYYLLLNAHDPSIAARIPTWGKDYWFDSKEIQTALSLIHAMDDVRESKGPIKPRRPTTLSDTSFTNYFSIVEDPEVSYTMACIAEIHFTTVRQGILKNLVRGYARYRDAPRTITASDLNAMLRFDTPEEAVEFAELHDFEMSMWVPEGKNPVTEPYLLLNNKKKHVPSPRVRQAFSGKVVERKRTTESLPHVIYNTIFEVPAETPASTESSPDGLFVSQAAASKDLSMGSPTFPPPAKPPISTPATQSPFGAVAASTRLPNGLPFGAAPTGAPAPAFAGFPASLPVSQPPATVAPNPFAAPAQPTSQAGKSPFSFLNPAPASTTTDTTPKPPLSQSVQTGPTTASPVAAAKAPEAPNPFASFKGFSSTAAPSFPPATHPTQTSSTASTPTPLFPSSAPASATFPTPAQATASVQAKPAEAPASFVTPGTAPPAGAPLFSTTPSTAPSAKPATTAPAVPSIFVSPPSVISTPSIQNNPALPATSSQPPGQPPLPGPPWQQPAFGGLGTSSATPPVLKSVPKRDLMGDLTKWYVKGDGGLMQDFTDEILRTMLWNVWQQFERDEAKRKKKEEDDESWRLAREHQTYRLRVKYFYRWRDVARALATKRILREGKEKMRLYREQQKALQRQQQEEKALAEREARRAARRQLAEDGQRLAMLASSARRRGSSVAYSADHDPEELLLASGIFGGLRDDPRAVARRVVREAALHAADGSVDPWSASRSYRYPESELELEPAPSTLEQAPSTLESPDASTVGGRREGWKTRSLREKFGIEPRRSLSASGSVVNGGSFVSSSSRFRQSLPGSGNPTKTTNFAASSRKRSAEEESDDDPGAKRYNASVNSGASRTLSKSRHWDLRARGFVPTPDGHWLPEAIARGSSQQQNDHHTSGSPPVDDFDHDHDHDRDRPRSATPSDLRLRLARLQKPRARAYTHRARHSVDLPTPTRGSRLLDTSPPHPPFSSTPGTGAGAMLPPAHRPYHSRSQYQTGNGNGNGNGMGGGGGKRKRGSEEVDDDEDGAGAAVDDNDGEATGAGREVSPSARRRKTTATTTPAVEGDVGNENGDGSGRGSRQTTAVVEDTRRKLRELREWLDEDKDVWNEVYAAAVQ